MSYWMNGSLLKAAEALTAGGLSDLAADMERVSEITAGADIGYAFRLPEAEFLVEEVDYAYDLKDLRRMPKKLCRVFGFQCMSMRLLSEGPGAFFPKRVLSNRPSGWITEYISKGYEPVDPIVYNVRESDSPFFWTDLECTAPILRHVLQRAASHGVGPSGYTIPIRTKRRDLFAASFTSSEPEAQFRAKIEMVEGDLRAVAKSLASAMARLQGVPDAQPPLTLRQLGLLRAVALGISKRRLHALGAMKDEICRLFGARDLPQAAACAASLGWLRDAPLTFEDCV